MDSPFTAPDVGQSSFDDEFDADEIPLFQRLRTRSKSFDFADIDLTYSEDVASPIASISFIPRDITKGAPMMPNPPAVVGVTEGFTSNPTSNHESAPRSMRPEERQDRNLVYADYDLSDEEDDLLIGVEDSLLENELITLEDEVDNLANEGNTVNDPVETSYDSAPAIHSEPMAERRHHRRASVVSQGNHDPLETSYDTTPNTRTEESIVKLLNHRRGSVVSFLDYSNAPQAETENLLDLTVPSLTPVPMRRAFSTPVHQSTRPPLRQNKLSVLSPADHSKVTQQETESLLDLTVPTFTPVPMRRVSSNPVRQSGRQQERGMPPLSQNKLQSPPSRSRRRDSLPAFSVSSPYSTGYALRRQVSASSLSSMDRIRSSSIQFSDDPPKETIGCENTPKNSSQGASIFRSGRSPGGVRTPSPKKASRLQRQEASERLTLSAPHPLWHMPPPPNSTESKTSGVLSINDTGTTTRIEYHPRNHRRSSVYDENWPDIKENPTGITDEVDSDVELARCNNGLPRRSFHHADNSAGALEADNSSKSKEEKIFFQRQNLRYMLYLSVFSIFGSTIRVCLVRIFGESCAVSSSTVDDEFCITATGRTMQRGGALFADLPANMVGCFIMGLMTTLHPDVWPPLPWFHADHPLQQNDAYHVGIRAGLCGSITTFASWNAQMIVMMDGTNTLLGSQVVTALSGYVFGFFCAIASFLVGTHVSIWLTRWRNPDIAREYDEQVRMSSPARRMEHEGGGEHGGACSNQPTTTIAFPAFLSTSPCCRNHWICKGHLLPFVLMSCLLLFYAIVGFLKNNLFCRTLFYSSLFTPPGALLRWELSKWNSRLSQHHWRRLYWFPVGTFIANVVGSLVSIALLAVESRYLFDEANDKIWAISLVTALRTGFAGSLSTVSSMVKEMFDLNAEYPHHAKAYHYALITVAVCVATCISVYSPIVRS